MSPDTLTTPTPEVVTPVSEAAPEGSRATQEALDLADIVDGNDTLNPRPTTTALSNLDFKTAEASPLPADVTTSETLDTKPTEKIVDAPEPVAEAPTTESPAQETADVEEADDDTVLPEDEQKIEREKAARMKTCMQEIVKDSRIPDYLKAEIISKAAAAGIDLDPRKGLDEKKFTRKQKVLIGIIGPLLFALMAVVAGASSVQS